MVKSQEKIIELVARPAGYQVDSAKMKLYRVDDCLLGGEADLKFRATVMVHKTNGSSTWREIEATRLLTGLAMYSVHFCMLCLEGKENIFLSHSFIQLTHLDLRSS